MKIFGDIRLEINGDEAYIHLPESTKVTRVFYGDSGSVEISAADGKLEAKVFQPQLQEA